MERERENNMERKMVGNEMASTLRSKYLSIGKVGLKAVRAVSCSERDTSREHWITRRVTEHPMTSSFEIECCEMTAWSLGAGKRR